MKRRISRATITTRAVITTMAVIAALFYPVLQISGPVRPAEAKTKKVIVIDAGHQTHAMSATEPVGPG